MERRTGAEEIKGQERESVRYTGRNNQDCAQLRGTMKTTVDKGGRALGVNSKYIIFSHECEKTFDPKQ